MILYHFTSLTYGLMAIRDQRLKISRFEELNDPFDHVGLRVEGGQQLEDLLEYRKIFQDEGGMICMSATFKEPLLWGHYGDNHRGMCLVFEADEINGEWSKVDYETERRTLKEYGVERVRDIPPAELFRIAHKKWKNWSYEQEWRRLLNLEADYYDFVHHAYFKPFDRHMKLKAVLFGYRAKVDRKQIDVLLEYNTEIQVGFTKPGLEEFKVILDDAETFKNVRVERALYHTEDGEK